MWLVSSCGDGLYCAVLLKSRDSNTTKHCIGVKCFETFYRCVRPKKLLEVRLDRNRDVDIFSEPEGLTFGILYLHDTRTRYTPVRT